MKWKKPKISKKLQFRGTATHLQFELQYGIQFYNDMNIYFTTLKTVSRSISFVFRCKGYSASLRMYWLILQLFCIFIARRALQFSFVVYVGFRKNGRGILSLSVALRRLSESRTDSILTILSMDRKSTGFLVKMLVA